MDEGRQMKYLVAFGVLALAGGAVAMAVAAPLTGMREGRAGGTMGHTAPGYVGVEVRKVSEAQASALKLKDQRGAEIIAVDHDGPACKAGVLLHDVILQMNGQIIEGDEQLRRMLRETPPGRVINFGIDRDGQQLTVTLQAADRGTVERDAWDRHYIVPQPDADSGVTHAGNSFFKSGAPSSAGVQSMKGHRDFLGTSMILSSSFTGAKLEVMGPQLAQFFGATDGAGLLVRSVEGNSPAEEAGMKAGDVVVRVNSIPVASGADWTKTVHDNKGRSLPVVVLRDRKEHTLTLTPDGKKRSSVKMGLGLEEFFQVKEQQTRELLARL
jgi:serine protease Do